MTPELNQLLTASGPGTALGRLFRSYWIPVLTSEDLPYAAHGPVLVEVLGQRFVAFRTNDGAVGLLDEACPHRRASLFYGRSEGDGLRCAYHGWKFAADGRCLETPAEPADSPLRRRVRAAAHPAVERGGIIFAYLGQGPAPEPPTFEWLTVPASHRYLSRRIQQCNYLQGLEGELDSSHASVLHSDVTWWTPSHLLGQVQLSMRNAVPRFEVDHTGFGLTIGAGRTLEDDRVYWRITQFVLPFYCFVAPFREGGTMMAKAFVPIDDVSCWVWNLDYHVSRPLELSEIAAFRGGGGIHSRLLPGSFTPVYHRGNDYGVDRNLQAAGSMTGIRNLSAQDAAVQESMGPVVDRTLERLGRGDVALARARQVLKRNADTVTDGGRPLGLDPATHRVRPGAFVLPNDEAWQRAAARLATGTLEADQA